jgi:hypothetical protein
LLPCRCVLQPTLVHLYWFCSWYLGPHVGSLMVIINLDKIIWGDSTRPNYSSREGVVWFFRCLGILSV